MTKNKYMRKRGGYWYFVRRVPKDAERIDGRRLITSTTGIRISDDPRGSTAGWHVAALNAVVEAEWAAKLAGCLRHRRHVSALLRHHSVR